MTITVKQRTFRLTTGVPSAFDRFIPTLTQPAFD